MDFYDMGLGQSFTVLIEALLPYPQQISLFLLTGSLDLILPHWITQRNVLLIRVVANLWLDKGCLRLVPWTAIERKITGDKLLNEWLQYYPMRAHWIMTMDHIISYSWWRCECEALLQGWLCKTHLCEKYYFIFNQ